MWEMERGAIPKGMQVCHKCDVGFCCNPSHLFLGTPQDNTDDKIKKGRDKFVGRPIKHGKYADPTLRGKYIPIAARRVVAERGT
jgi:hypothetical protein